MTEYANALAYFFNLEKFGIVFGLENIKWILALIGNPHESLKVAHIGGTNGKGSVAAMMSHVLMAAGYKVGRYTSPHLVSFTERIMINEERIPEAEVAELTAHIRQHAEENDPRRKFTFFDFTTALAFEYFCRKNVDIALIEVGLGGRLDSTNVVNPLVSVITNVTLDHTDHLGEDVLGIAREKAGIIKKGVPVVTGAQDGPAGIIEKAAQACGSQVKVMGRDFSWEKKKAQTMSYTGLSTRLDDVFVNMNGDHQLSNAAMALCGMELLGTQGFGVSPEFLYRGLSEVKWPGRIEIVRENPTVVVDGAHNMAGIKALVSFLKDQYPDRRKVLVFGVMKDKEYGKMLGELLPAVDEIILTEPANERALEPESIKGCVPNAYISSNTVDALEKAKHMAEEKDVIIVTGSLYLVGECMAIINDVF